MSVLIENLRDIAQTLDRMGGDASPIVIREAIRELQRWESAYERAAQRIVELQRELDKVKGLS